MYYSDKEYKLIGFQKSIKKNKKYDAIIQNKKNNEIKYISFGQLPYEHFSDKLKLYSYLDHNDEKRKKLYYNRHKNDINKPFSASYFSNKILW